MLRLSWLLLLVAAVLSVGGTVRAEEKTVECKFVEAADGRMTVTGPDGNQHTAAVEKDAPVTLDGKKCKLEDLKKGQKVKITVRKDDGEPVITKVEGSSK